MPLTSDQINGLAGAFIRLLDELGGETWDFTQAVQRADELLSLRLQARLAGERAAAMGLAYPVPIASE